MLRFQKRASVIVLCFLLLLLPSCKAATVDDYFTFQKDSFVAEIQGELNGTTFSAKISSRPTDVGHDVCIEFLSPHVLEGVRIELSDGKDAILYRGELSIPCKKEALDGLLSPVTSLLELATPSTVQKLDGNVHLAFPSETTLVLSPSLVPVSFSSPSVEYSIIWWE